MSIYIYGIRNIVMCISCVNFSDINYMYLFYYLPFLYSKSIWKTFLLFYREIHNEFTSSAFITLFRTAESPHRIWFSLVLISQHGPLPVSSFTVPGSENHSYVNHFWEINYILESTISEIVCESLTFLRRRSSDGTILRVPLCSLERPKPGSPHEACRNVKGDIWDKSLHGDAQLVLAMRPSHLTRS